MSPPSILNGEHEMVPVDDLVLHPNNPNEGDAGAVAESISFHGFYGVLYVQRSTRTVVAGNHRLVAARQLGMTEVPVVWLDVDDEQAARILLVDNETTRKGRNDESILVNLLQSLAMTEDGLAGTGFDGDDLDAMMQEATKPLRTAATKFVVSVVAESEEDAKELAGQLASMGREAKIEKK